MILPIYIYGSGVLRKKAREMDIASIDKEEIGKLVSDMFETMRNADGVGLAAPQIGKDIRLLVVDGSDIADMYPELKDFRRAMLNPVFLEKSTEMSEYGEGCLSVPDVHCNIVRPRKVRVRYFDPDLISREEEFDGFASRMVQHEMDHLDGLLFTDHAAPIRKKMISSRLHNIARGKVSAHYNIKLDK